MLVLLAPIYMVLTTGKAEQASTQCPFLTDIPVIIIVLCKLLEHSGKIIISTAEA